MSELKPPCNCNGGRLYGLGVTSTGNALVDFLRGDFFGSLVVFGFAGIVLWKILR